MSQTSAERVKAYRERARNQNLRQRSIYLPEGEPTPTGEELAVLRQLRKTAKDVVASSFPFKGPDALQVTMADVKAAADRTRTLMVIRTVQFFFRHGSDDSTVWNAADFCRELQVTEKELAGFGTLNQGVDKKLITKLRKAKAFQRGLY